MRPLRVLLVLVLALTAGAGAALPPSAQEGDPAAAGGAAELEAEADRAFAADDYETAETKYRAALAMRADSVHTLSRLALLLTWKGEYKEAIALYRRALFYDGSRIQTRRGLAIAYTWSEDYRSALALYRELLAERPGDEGITYEMAQAQAWSGDLAGALLTLHRMVDRNPRHVKGRILLAQVHAWSGEYAEAGKICTSVLSEEPDNLEALNGLGGALAEQGRLEDARDTFDRALAIDPKNRPALEGRARVLHWQGRTTEALVAVRDALELYPDARDARRLGREIGGPLRPTLQLFATTMQDTDDNDMATWGGTYTHYFGGRGYAGATFTHAQTDARADTPAGLSITPVARYDTLRLVGGWHASRQLSLYGALGAERTRLPINTDPLAGSDPNIPVPEDGFSHPAGSFTFEVNGGDWFTLAGAVSRERLLGTTQAFMNDVGLDAATLSVHVRPHPRLRLRLTGQKARFTDERDYDVTSAFEICTASPGSANCAASEDDNRRSLAAGAASWRVPLRRPKLFLNYNGRWISYARDLDHGYFDPDHFVSHTVGFDLSDTMGRLVYWGVGADAGIQRVDDREDDDVLGYRVLGGVHIGRSVSIEAYYSRSDLAAQSAAGFRYTDAGLRMKFRFGHELGPALPGHGIPGKTRDTGR
ncbi:MAG TPA: tetratricopeptide repeat protein [Candidatus Polarisedimenticolia bacterium]|nr:tetratricopeptide repeat protein [Candidatus Polarisedimenticolia bacterium]